MKNTLLAVMLCGIMGSCFKEDTVSPEIIIEPKSLVLISHDSIATGAYLGLKIESKPSDIYAQIQ